MKKSAVVIFPGRGSYGKDELGYLARHQGGQSDFIAKIDRRRKSAGHIPVSELDAAKTFSPARHAAGGNASALIYACALTDFAQIDRSRFDILAFCGNSLGWYLTLAAAGALNEANAMRLVDIMGALMEEKGVGSQLVYPLVDENWREDAQRVKAVSNALHDGRNAGEAYLSIRLGGLAVLAGDEKGLAAAEKVLPKIDNYPFRLARHAAFHTPLMAPASEAAMGALGADLFAPPRTPVIDGRGAVWSPYATDPHGLRQYTLATQVVETYDFSKSIEVAIKEFAPEVLILAGPGASLGAAVAQELIRHRWLGLSGKADFASRQKEDPFLLAMGRKEQRALVV